MSSRPGAQGLAPELGPAALLSYVPELGERFAIDCRAVLNLDSSNIQPEEWQLLARAVLDDRVHDVGEILRHHALARLGIRLVGQGHGQTSALRGRGKAGARLEQMPCRRNRPEWQPPPAGLSDAAAVGRA